jgi:predicted ABC-type transport system involved in lysophospholipase L1 biosynthesis ATPase subunit
MSSDRPIFQVERLRTHFFTRKGVVKAVDDVSFALRRGEIMGLVGESGAGKSITGFSILRLIDPPGRIVAGRILLDGEDLLAKSEAEMAAIRGERIGMVFQDPQTSLDPVFSIGYQIGEALAVHHPMSRADGRGRAVGMLRRVGIPSPEDRLDSYPHQFSGWSKSPHSAAQACSPPAIARRYSSSGCRGNTARPPIRSSGKFTRSAAAHRDLPVGAIQRSLHNCLCFRGASQSESMNLDLVEGLERIMLNPVTGVSLETEGCTHSRLFLGALLLGWA